jgi:predicted GIY-YIG superfamily endonuclease
MSREVFYVYMMTNKGQTTLYIGVTNSLVRRVHQHRSGDVSGFTERYNLYSSVIPSDVEESQRSAGCDCAREAAEALAQREEGVPDRKDESDVGGFGRECARTRVGARAGVEED